MDYLKGLIFAWSILCCSSEMVRLHSTGNTIGTLTSSTLSWLPSRLGDDTPENAVSIGKGGPIWCRSFHHGIYVSGAVIEGSCRAPFVGNVVVDQQFQVLVSINGSARLVNVLWDSFMSFPSNPVSTPNMLLAINSDAEIGIILPGYVDPMERRAHFVNGNTSLKLTGGFLVTEDEPIAYDLSNVRLDANSKKTFHEEVMHEFLLENPTEYPDKVSREITFISPYQTYYGKVQGTIVALPASVHGPDAIPVNITWGIKNILDKERKHVVSYNLPAGTKVSVKLIAVVRTIDGAYGGTLTSFYKDGERIQRRIGGLHIERLLSKLRADFSQVRYISDDSPVQELPPHTTVLLHSSTTTPIPTELQGDASEKYFLPSPQSVGVNGAPSLVYISSGCLTFWSFLLLACFLK